MLIEIILESDPTYSRLSPERSFSREATPVFDLQITAQLISNFLFSPSLFMRIQKLYKFVSAVAIAILVPFPALSQEKARNENSENWYVTSSWIKEVTEEEQIIAASLALEALSQKTASLLEYQRDGKQVAWVVKITACGYSMLSKIMTKTPTFQSYLAGHSDLYIRFIRGEIKRKDFLKSEQAFLDEQENLLSKGLDVKSLAITKTQYKDRIAATNRSFVAYSMICASGQSGKNSNASNNTIVAQNYCSPKGIDVCQLARKIANETAATLPVLINKNTSVQTAFSERNVVTLVANFQYDRIFLEQTLADTGMTDKQLLKVMHESARSPMCAPGSPTKMFIDSGGVISYLYKFNDGKIYTNVRIVSCDY
jgi:hypothetical protein